jgi:ABC-type sugar transport system substrate-binding protein
MGYQAVKLAGQLARGQVKASQVKEEHLLPFFVVTRKNVNNPKVKQYFYKASC